ncbi:hypothetical protein IGL98_000964 [Enterococcus sp. DIV0840]|uniref:hypothetical protein n=1 Tax=unclassified Enterococcus TaxID=2608891 RepID=UPI001A8FB667|nr:hypothetical protein [Enterococcus sp. DIV0849a]MBO0433639.1 hypothetical protein [Enterococcus sp. DIV0849a]
MNYLIDSYAPYLADGGVLGKLAEGINWLFVDMPFFILRLFTSGVLIQQQLLDQTDLIMSKQQEAYTLSVEILKNFGGKEITKGSILALLILLSAYYLLYNFFVSKKSFSKVLLHYLAVFVLFVFWFGSIAIPSGSQSGGLFLVESVSNVATAVKNNFTSGSNDFSNVSSEQAIDDTPLFNATIKQTFYYVNTGSLDGEMENGKKIDEKKLLMPSGLSKEKKKTFEQDRKKYIDSIKEDNPYVQVSLDKTMEKLVAIFTGGVNTMVTSYPSLYVNAMLSVIQLIITLLIIVAPVFFLLSFVPACQSMLFKFFKLLIGLLFFPVVLGVFLAVFFWANKVIDTIYLNAMKLVATPILTLMTGGIFILVSNFVLIIIKYFLYKSIWKNKYELLGFFTDGQVEQPEILQKTEEKMEEKKERAKEIGVGGVELAAGAYTGNQMLMMDGANKLMPNDKAMNLGRYNFKDSDMNEPEGQNGLDEWVENQEDSPTIPSESPTEDVEFVEIDDDSTNGIESKIELEDVNVDRGLVDDKMPEMYTDVTEESLEDGTTVSVDNLDEISLESSDEINELKELEQVEKETVVERDEYELDKEFPEDIFFGKEIESELNDED